MGTTAHTRPLRTESTMAEGPNTWVARLQCVQRGKAAKGGLGSDHPMQSLESHY